MQYPAGIKFVTASFADYAGTTTGEQLRVSHPHAAARHCGTSLFVRRLSLALPALVLLLVVVMVKDEEEVVVEVVMAVVVVAMVVWWCLPVVRLMNCVCLMFQH